MKLLLTITALFLCFIAHLHAIEDKAGRFDTITAGFYGEETVLFIVRRFARHDGIMLLRRTGSSGSFQPTEIPVNIDPIADYLAKKDLYIDSFQINDVRWNGDKARFEGKVNVGCLSNLKANELSSLTAPFHLQQDGKVVLSKQKHWVAD